MLSFKIFVGSQQRNGSNVYVWCLYLKLFFLVASFYTYRVWCREYSQRFLEQCPFIIHLKVNKTSYILTPIILFLIMATACKNLLLLSLDESVWLIVLLGSGDRNRSEVVEVELLRSARTDLIFGRGVAWVILSFVLGLNNFLRPATEIISAIQCTITAQLRWQLLGSLLVRSTWFCKNRVKIIDSFGFILYRSRHRPKFLMSYVFLYTSAAYKGFLSRI